MHILNVISSVSIGLPNAPKSLAAGASPQIPLGSLQCSPDPLAGFERPSSKDPTSKGKGGEKKREKGEVAPK